LFYWTETRVPKEKVNQRA